MAPSDHRNATCSSFGCDQQPHYCTANLLLVIVTTWRCVLASTNKWGPAPHSEGCYGAETQHLHGDIYTVALHM